VHRWQRDHLDHQLTQPFFSRYTDQCLQKFDPLRGLTSILRSFVFQKLFLVWKQAFTKICDLGLSLSVTFKRGWSLLATQKRHVVPV